MVNGRTDEERVKKERSPSFPFISLRRAVERAEQFQAAHKRDAARLSTVAPTWKYGVKSSGLLQTAAALKQYGLIEDVGSGEERRLQLTDLARRILSDTRPGVKEQALAEAAQKPKLFAEYIGRWVPDAPDDRHCISELELDRGFTPDAAKAFLKSFKLTVSYAGLMARDSISSLSLASQDNEDEELEIEKSPSAPQSERQFPAVALIGIDAPLPPPFAQRCKVEMVPGSVRVNATLMSAGEVDKLIRILEANKALLEDDDIL